MNQLKNMLDTEMLARRESRHGKVVCILRSHVCVYNTWDLTVSVIILAEPWMGLMGDVLKSLEVVMFRMNGDGRQQQDGTTSHSHRESERHTGYIQVSHPIGTVHPNMKTILNLYSIL